MQETQKTKPTEPTCRVSETSDDTTWLELFAFYRLQAGKVQGECDDVIGCDDPVMLAKGITTFKSVTRRLARMTAAKNDEWISKPSIRKNPLVW